MMHRKVIKRIIRPLKIAIISTPGFQLYLVVQNFGIICARLAEQNAPQTHSNSADVVVVAIWKIADCETMQMVSKTQFSL